MGKVGSQPVELRSLRGSTLVSSNLDCEFYGRVEVTNSGKHSCLLQYSKNYGRKRFYSTGPAYLARALNYARKVLMQRILKGQVSLYR
jgi:hypothetical protein